MGQVRKLFILYLVAKRLVLRIHLRIAYISTLLVYHLAIKCSPVPGVQIVKRERKSGKKRGETGEEG